MCTRTCANVYSLTPQEAARRRAPEYPPADPGLVPVRLANRRPQVQPTEAAWLVASGTALRRSSWEGRFPNCCRCATSTISSFESVRAASCGKQSSAQLLWSGANQCWGEIFQITLCVEPEGLGLLD